MSLKITSMVICARNSLNSTLGPRSVEPKIIDRERARGGFRVERLHGSGGFDIQKYLSLHLLGQHVRYMPILSTVSPSFCELGRTTAGQKQQAD